MKIKLYLSIALLGLISILALPISAQSLLEFKQLSRNQGDILHPITGPGVYGNISIIETLDDSEIVHRTVSLNNGSKLFTSTLQSVNLPYHGQAMSPELSLTSLSNGLEVIVIHNYNSNDCYAQEEVVLVKDNNVFNVPLTKDHIERIIQYEDGVIVHQQKLGCRNGIIDETWSYIAISAKKTVRIESYGRTIATSNDDFK